MSSVSELTRERALSASQSDEHQSEGGIISRTRKKGSREIKNKFRSGEVTR